MLERGREQCTQEDAEERERKTQKGSEQKLVILRVGALNVKSKWVSTQLAVLGHLPKVQLSHSLLAHGIF